MRRKRFWIMAAVLALLLALMPPTHPAQADTYTVNSINDVDDGTCNSTHCSLHEAINAANNNAGADIIDFDITSGCDTITGVCTIQLGSGLPWLTDDGTTIDGYSQDGAERATDTTPATLKIELDGTKINSIGGPGFVIVSAGNVISGVVVNRFSRYGVRIYGSSATSNTVSGNYIGTDANGTGDPGNGRHGVYIHGGAQNNTVGGDTTSERNIISGNEWSGVYIAGIGTNGNHVWGNYIGTNISATGVLSNTQDGVFIGWGAQDNTIGVDTDGNGKGNVISGNGTTGNEWGGVSIYSTGTTSNTVSGNYIGTDASGTLDLGNVGFGVYIYDGAQNNTVGGRTTGERNIISGNGFSGVLIASDGTTGNRVWGNYIGTNISATGVLSNGQDGVLIGNGAQNNTVGGDMDGERNIISGNSSEGVRIQGSGTMSNTVFGNYIGTDAYGTADLGNGGRGVFITSGAQNNTVGGTTNGERNIISGNELSGVSIVDDDTTGNHVWGNYIGTNISGTGVLSNGRHGVFIGGGAYNTIGGDTDGNGKGNVISGNEWSGVWITGTETMSNTVFGNYIGTDAHGTAGLGNIWRGVFIGGGAQNNTVGGDMDGERNIISGNGGSGIVISGTGTIGNNVWGNYIGTNISGTEVLSNTNHGVYITDGAQNNPVGPGNVIAHNGWDGVNVDGSSTTGNTITQNSIFSNILGIDLTGGANGGIAAPVIVTTTFGSVNIVGTACAGCTVEVFENTDTDGEGETYIGDTTADTSGAFTVTVSSLSHPYLTATATDAVSGTSEFSAVFTSTVTASKVYLPIILKNH